MKRADKRQAEKVIELLKCTHTMIKKTLDARNLEATMELLEQCQSCAISLGETIEETEGEGFITVSLLENYCEMVYQTYEKIKQFSVINSSQIHNELSRELIKIGNSIKHDIPVRTEAIFLPYKVSMWDSLESIWKAASEDSSCDAYVIPIPYYDRNPDGSFGNMHYEGNLYPDYVPITYYRDYNFAQRQPDMIFIHNPYDEYNYVTSVHPFFYAKNLKQFTEKLVYVPYFILHEPNRNDAKAIEEIAHFCTTLGVIYADKVIVQSENMRQIYIDVITKFMERRGLKRKYWEDKILGLGSPKMDKVLNTKKEEQEIPKEWLKVIEKPDGSWKKVVLYNTSVGAFLEHTENYFDKMNSVFEVFRQYEDTVALLWRPHPLFRTTLQAMRPEMREVYERLVDKYCKEDWGIYDDSTELNRAIAICDAYYGDGSSVVELCREAGKMIMIQNVEV